MPEDQRPSRCLELYRAVAGLGHAGGLIAALTWAPHAEGTKVWLGGTFLNAGGTIRPSLAAIDSGTALATTPLVTPGGPVKSLAISGANLYIGGDARNLATRLPAS